MSILTKSVLIALLLFIVSIGSILVYLLLTEKGLLFIARTAIKYTTKAEPKKIRFAQGTLYNGFTLQGIELTNLEGFPFGTKLRIQGLTVKMKGLDYKNARVDVINARLLLPISHNIMVSGWYENEQFDFTVFAPVLDVKEILNSWPKKNLVLMLLSGTLTGIDLHCSGNLENPKVKGKFIVEELTHKDIVLTDAPAEAELVFSDLNKDVKINGQVIFAKGQLQTEHTTITFKKSGVYFSGDPVDPRLSIEGYSEVSRVFINLFVKGTAKKPDLNLSSDPPLSREQLMVMLATGRRWASLETLQQGQFSPELAKDFLGYLLFPGSGKNGFLSKLGIKDVKIIYEDNKKGVGFKKEISKELDVGYEIEQENSTVNPEVSQTLGADYRVSNQVFFSVERQKQLQGVQPESQPTAADSRVLLKYKKRF